MKKMFFILGLILPGIFTCNNNYYQSKKTKKVSTSIFKPLDWVKQTNVYEVNLRQYTQEGTFSAFAKELPRLKDMGVQTLWFMPITPISKKVMKGTMGSYYACSDYTAINPEFGNLDDFKSLVRQAHEMGFKVIIDWVANHTGWDHRWTTEHPDWFEKDEATGDFKRASGMDDIIELDFKNPELRKAMIDAMKYWVTECDIDGYRCDLAFWVELDFWMEARPQIDAVKPLFWLGEFDELESPDYMQAFDVCYSWMWMHKVMEFYQQKQSISNLDSLLHRYDTAAGEKGSIQIWFTTNHDENSWNGTEYEKYGDMAKALAVFSATWSGIPLIYSGQEMPNMKRLAFFDKDPIEWTGNNQLHDFYKKLLTLHRNNPALLAGELHARPQRISTGQDEKVFAFIRKNGEREIVVILNFSSENIEHIKLLNVGNQGEFSNLFSGEKITLSPEMEFSLSPWNYLVFER